MPQADFVYQPANDAAGMPLAVSIFADRAHLRDEIRDDVAAAGLEVRECDSLTALLEGLALLWLIDPQATDWHAQAEASTRLFLRGLGASPDLLP